MSFWLMMMTMPRSPLKQVLLSFWTWQPAWPLSASLEPLSSVGNGRVCQGE